MQRTTEVYKSQQKSVGVCYLFADNIPSFLFFKLTVLFCSPKMDILGTVPLWLSLHLNTSSWSPGALSQPQCYAREAQSCTVLPGMSQFAPWVPSCVPKSYSKRTGRTEPQAAKHSILAGQSMESANCNKSPGERLWVQSQFRKFMSLHFFITKSWSTQSCNVYRR